ncbi:hypothetical protein CJ030_MR5G023535 [Morella rubra]|uniref:Uncharacterized protein n=1 Tax=Morella rubra TaxID=262757 RepID=A0A6A1VIH2_9ROSI|nr:hypothetical protein CJ030_MR5G023535 [Morella rubra]
MRRESPINVDRRHEEEFPLWFRNRDDVMPAGGKRLRCDSSVRAESSPRRPESDMFENVPALLVFNSKEEALEHPYPDMNKEEWTRVCDLFASEEFQRRSAINKENRAKLKIVHTSGARSFQRARALLKNPESDEISPALLYKKTHTNKDGMWTSEDARENFLEEARLQIEEMRARQLEYEALLVKRSDMEQTMREHLQMMEEQQRKKDEELMQMMASSNEKKTKSIGR